MASAATQVAGDVESEKRAAGIGVAGRSWIGCVRREAMFLARGATGESQKTEEQVRLGDATGDKDAGRGMQRRKWKSWIMATDPT
jgi:hypothetical protein